MRELNINTTKCDYLNGDQEDNTSEYDDYEDPLQQKKQTKNLFDGILKDLNDEITLAVFDLSSMNKWGKYYLRSLMFANLYQKKNNFKDKSVEHYGGLYFDKQIKNVNKIFDNLPILKPSRKQQHHQVVRDMTRYNNCYGGCFSEDSLITLYNGEKIRCDEIKPNMEILSSNNRKSKIYQILKIKGNNMKLIHFQDTNLKITPYHPIYKNNKWEFPCNIDYNTHKIIDSDVVYNFVLDHNHTMYINNTIVCTLGHGIRGKDKIEDKIIHHIYFGSMKSIIEDLSKMKGFDNQFIELNSDTLCIKDIDNIVCRMVQNFNTIYENIMIF